MAASITLAWDPNTEPELTGYRLHYGIASRTYTTHTAIIDKASTTATIDIPDGVRHYFAVTALGANGRESDYSIEVAYPEFISPPQLPSGQTSVVAGSAHVYTTGGAVSSTRDGVQYRFNWGDGSVSPWLTPAPGTTTVSASKSWAAAGSYEIVVEAGCAVHSQVAPAYSGAITVTVADSGSGSTVNFDELPTAPSGPASVSTGRVYAFTTGSAVTSTGEAVQYRLQWGDGSVSPWLSPALGTNTVTASKSWAAAGAFDVVAEARCATHTEVTGVSTATRVAAIGGSPLRIDDTFSDGTLAGDPQWRTVSGRWLVGADRVFTAVRTNVVNRAVVRALPRFKGGRVATRLALTPAGLRQETGIVFALRDAQHYRYVTISGSRIAIGQVGDTAGTKAGLKASAARAFADGVWHRLRVDILPYGTVKVFLGTSKTPVLSYRFADTAAGGVGCLAANSVAYFDDFRVWDARILR